MLISYQQKFIFFHVAKVAGMSMRTALEDYIQEPDFFRIQRPKATLADGKPNPMYGAWEAFLLHVTTQDANKYLPDNLFTESFKFAFVRNPWDWQVSMYHFILREPTHIRYKLVSAMPDFAAYLDWIIATDKPYPKGATKFQKDVICDENGKLMVDFVGRYENLQTDFAKACELAGVEAKLPHHNRSKHTDYRDYYTDATRALVAEHFAEDIALFGYDFDGIATEDANK